MTTKKSQQGTGKGSKLMSQVSEIEQPKRDAISIGVSRSREVYPLIPQSVAHIEELAAFMLRAGAIPKSYYDRSITDEKQANAVATRKAGIAIMKGLEIGWLPMQSVQNMYVINGIPTLYGDGAMALVRSSGLLVDAKETFEGEGDSLVAICELQRVDQDTPIVRKFSRADAAKAGLLSKSGPWKDYPHRMMQMRARSWALRDGFADALLGLRIKEEVEDYERAEQPKSKIDPFAAAPTLQIAASEAADTAAAAEKEEVDATDIA